MTFDFHHVYNWLLDIGLSAKAAQNTNMWILLVGLLLIMILADWLGKKILRRLSHRLASKSKTEFDDFLIENKTPTNVAHIIPLVLAKNLYLTVFADFPAVGKLVDKGLQVAGIVLTLWIVRSILNTFKDYFKTLPSLKDKPIDSYIQVFMIFAWLVGFMMAFAVITNSSVWKLLTAFGAASAVIILVFKDTILGFVASIQVSINDMVRIGDWITFDKYGADGDVTEINLATVKVQNFDKTITTIPTYALISDSFKNWRGMSESGGRRIKRAVYIRQGSIRFLNDEDIDRLRKIELISKYLERKRHEIDTFNKDKLVNKEVLVNGRNLTNMGVLRKYLDSYLNTHSAINKDMTIMIRQLSPTEKGVPLEIYAFSKDKNWENYEYIMADIFDHVFSAIGHFDLEVFELPSHSSFTKFS